jgi:arylsulfatase A-like enzyme
MQAKRSTVLVMGASLALILASLDLILGLRSSADTAPATLARPAAATAAAAWVLYCLCWFGACVPLRRVFRLRSSACAVGLVVVMGGTCLALLVLQRMQMPSTPVVCAAAGAVALVCGFVAARIVNLIGRNVPIDGRLNTYAMAATTLAISTAAAIWFRQGDGPAVEPARSFQPTAAFDGKVRHVILIVVDTLRADALSCYDPAVQSTPVIDGLAAESVLFETARSAAPWTLPSMCSLMTGVGASVHLAVRGESVLPTGPRTLAEHMRAAGYRTAAIGRNAFLHPRSRLDRGFDEYTMYPRLWSGTPIGSAILDAISPPEMPAEPIAGDLTRAAGAWLEQHREQPFFLWLHYFDPHWPFEPPRKWAPEGDPPSGLSRRFAVPISEARTGHFSPDLEQRAWIRSLYEAEVRYTDHAIGRLFEKLKALGIYDDALIVLTSDHGEELWEHDSFEHGHSAYDELLRVPLMLKVPGQAPRRRADPVSITSLTPTLLELCSVEADGALFSAPRLFGPDPASAPVVASGLLTHENRTAVVSGTWKYIRRALTGKEELYDLARDPGEQDSLVTRAPPELEVMRAAMQAQAEGAAALRERLGILQSSSQKMDAATQREMRSLGYLK